MALSGMTLGCFALTRASDDYKHCECQYASQNENQSFNHNNSPTVILNCLGYTFDKHNGTITAIATILLVFVTAGLIVSGIYQLNTTQQQLRAYVFMDKIELLDFGVGKVPSAKITIKNFGQTPAKDFSLWATMGFDLVPPTLPNPIGGDDPMHKHPLAPGGYIHVIPKYKKSLDANEVAGIEKGEVALYFFGEVYYTDVFGKRHITRYKMFSNGNTSISSGNCSATKEDNDYT